MKREERDAFVGKEFYKLFHDLGRPSILFQEGFYALGGTNGHATTSPFPEPWQSLSPEIRAILQETATWTPEMLIKLAPFRWAHPARAMVLANDLEKAFTQRKSTKKTNFLTVISNLNPAEAKKEADEFLSGDKPRSERPSWMYPNGHETLAVEIEWGDFTNDEIVAGFRKWVKVHRPKHIKAPSGQGNKVSDLRAALKRLGIMRALNVFTLADHRFPQQLRDLEDKACYAARKEAGKTFRKLFPFLPSGDEPIHWKTKGGKGR